MEWISVEDKLPEDDCRVDVYNANEDKYNRLTDVNYSVYRKEFFIDYDITDITDSVTHWMPLPNPPKE